MILLQAMIDSSISANWFFGIVLSVLSILIYRLLNRVEKTLEDHDKRLQDHEIRIQLGKQEIDRMAETYVATHKETLMSIMNKLGALGAYQK